MSHDAAREEIIRAGATYPSAVPSSYFQPSENPPSSGWLKKRTVSTSCKNTRPRPAFGATRDEGAVGPVEALSPYADAVDHNRQHLKPFFEKSRSRGKAPSQGILDTVVKGPTAEEIISMTAAGQKPPVPEAEHIERHRKSLLRISKDMEAAVSSQLKDQNESLESISFAQNIGVLSDRISGYRQTWGVAFSQKH